MKICAVILAAGRGKRMKSLKPKVLHKVSGKPLLQYSIDAVKALNPQKLIIVISNATEEIRKHINNKTVFFVTQRKLLGTGNALAVAKNVLGKYNDTTTVVLNGDSPLITSKTLKFLLQKHKRNNNALSFLSFIDNSVSGYGRVLRNSNSKVISIVEEKHATFKDRGVKELNGGVYAIEHNILHYLNKLRKHTSSGEYYLTDIVEIASKRGEKVNAYSCPPEEVRGINTRAELYQVSKILNNRIISHWMKKGVTFIAPEASILHHSVSIGKDTIIYPNTCLEGNTTIGKNCIIYPGVRISNSIIGNGVLVKDCSIIEDSRIKETSTVGPFAQVRANSIVNRNVENREFSRASERL
jgi:bifunctional UDP-N-acetylglucosamine pyrophosphorylase/glucosamine-1-phosphate N-acetyltransferase